MRYLTYISFVAGIFCWTSALASMLEPSPVKLSVSGFPHLERVPILHLDTFHHILHNETVGSNQYLLQKPQESICLERSSISVTYKFVDPQLTKMKLRGSRTRGLNGGGYNPTPSRARGHPTPPISLSTSLCLWRDWIMFGMLITLSLLASRRGLMAAIECAGNAWYDLTSDTDSFMTIVLTQSAVILWAVSCWLLPWLYWCLDALQVYLTPTFDKAMVLTNQFMDQERTRQWNKRRLECIRRKKFFSTSSSSVHRTLPKHSSTPFFKRGQHVDLSYVFLPEEKRRIRHMYDPRHLNRVKKIGAGAFGSIYQVEHRITGKMMAMKMLVKELNTGDDVNLEIRSLSRLQDEIWFPKLLSTFKDSENFYILMSFYTRGDLYALMMASGGCITRALAKFYLSELLIAIRAIHQYGIIHRDLKPENILFNENGHLVVADFGVAHTFVESADDAFMDEEYPLWASTKGLGGDDFPLLTPSVDNPHSIKGSCGTPFYSAPEVLAMQNYSYGVDYYSMAVLYHEMVTGFIPFQVVDAQQAGNESGLLVDLGRKNSHLQTISMTDLSFLQRVLHTNPYSRPSVKEMKGDPVFYGIDWEKMAKQQVPVPLRTAIRKRVSSSDAVERDLTQTVVE